MTPERWRRIEELYGTALGLPVEERSARLREACASDDDLRREVQALLDEPQGSGFLAQPAAVRAAELIAASPAQRVGLTLGRYRLEALVGVGGMGEVYRAHDATLGRDVAIKVLPDSLTANPDRLARLEREARLLAALNHPGICGIHGIEEVDGTRLLILEYIEGQTLAERLASRREGGQPGVPISETLDVARQLADALEEAHDKGIVHRDLKPANIKITPEGAIKILDFGLAKAVDPDSTAPDLTLAPVSASGRRRSVVMGTAAYMSPEQARGLFVDRRTDIWAFGCLLYEMLTGRIAFAGETVSDSIAKVLEREPDWSALPAATPVGLRRLLVRALTKDPKKRLRAIGDARLEIDGLDEVLPGVAEGGSAPSSVPDRRRWLPWTASALLGVGLVGSLAVIFRPVPPQAVTRFTHALPTGQTLNGSRGARIVAVSADGSVLAYSGAPYGLYLRSLSDFDATLVPGTESYEVAEPAFSPDGRMIAFFSVADQALKKIAVTGGPAQTLGPARSPFGIHWSRGDILFGQGSGGISRVSAEGGTPEELVSVGANELAHGPQLLPDGEHLLFTLAKGSAPSLWDKGQIIVQSLKTGERKTLIDGGSDARYLPTGHLIYAFSGRVYAVGMDERSLAVTGERVLVIDGIRRAAGNFTGAASFAVSASGTLVFVPGPGVAESSAPRDLALMDRKGTVQKLNLAPGPYAHPRISPDLTRVAFDSDDGNGSVVYWYELSGRTKMQELTSDGDSRFPVWTSDDRVAFQSDRDGTSRIWWQAFDGAAEPLTLPDSGGTQTPESWFGDTLLYSVTKGSEVTLWTLSVRDRRTTRLDVAPSTAPMDAVFSPDGRWIAYSSTQGNRMTLYIQRFPTGKPFPLTAKPEDTPKQPRWSRDGMELCYNPNARSFECLPITTTPFAFGTAMAIPKNLILSPPGKRANYDIAGDGRMVGFVRAGAEERVRVSANQLQIVLNWFEELRMNVPIR